MFIRVPRDSVYNPRQAHSTQPGYAPVIEYIKSQKEHHLCKSLDEEFKELMHSTGLDYNPDDFR